MGRSWALTREILQRLGLRHLLIKQSQNWLLSFVVTGTFNFQTVSIPLWKLPIVSHLTETTLPFLPTHSLNQWLVISASGISVFKYFFVNTCDNGGMTFDGLASPSLWGFKIKLCGNKRRIIAFRTYRSIRDGQCYADIMVMLNHLCAYAGAVVEYIYSWKCSFL